MKKTRKNKQDTSTNNIVSNISDNNAITVVYGIGRDLYGSPYVYFEYDKEYFDAIESLEHEIIDNIIHPINIFPNTTFNFNRHSHDFWSVVGHIPADKSIEIENDINTYAYYWIMVHWYDKEIDIPVHMSAAAIDSEHYNDDTINRLEEILKNKEFDYRLISTDNNNGAYIVSFCDTWDNVEHLKEFMSKYLGYTEDEIREIMPEYFDYIAVKKYENEIEKQ